MNMFDVKVAAVMFSGSGYVTAGGASLLSDWFMSVEAVEECSISEGLSSLDDEGDAERESGFWEGTSSGTVMSCCARILRVM